MDNIAKPLDMNKLNGCSGKLAVIAFQMYKNWWGGAPKLYGIEILSWTHVLKR